MSIRDIFSKTKKRGVMIQPRNEKAFPEGLMMKCPACRKIHLSKEVEQNLKVCPSCQHHLKMTAHERVAIFLDQDTFESFDDHLQTTNPLHFPAYVEKVQVDMKKTGLNEAVLTGQGKLKGEAVIVAIMTPISVWVLWVRLLGRKLHGPLNGQQRFVYRSLFLQQVAVHVCKKVYYRSCKWLKRAWR